MKIIHYLNHGHVANGHVAVAVDLACEQADTGHDVHFVSGRCDFTQILSRHGVSYHEVPEERGALRFFKMAQRLRPILKRIRPDVINAHMVAAALAAKINAVTLPFKLVTTIHNSFDKQSALMGVGDLVIAVSDAVSQEMQSRWIPRRKLRVVRNGTIGGARRTLLPLEQRELQRPAIVTVAGLHARKGISDLIAAFEAVFRQQPSAHLYIIGEGPERRNYEAQAAAQTSAAHIHFTGHQDDPRSSLVNADIFVLASLQDPFPLVLSEARQMGCAIVATQVGGIPEALWHGDKGILVPPADPTRLAAAIIDLLEHEPKRAALGTAASTDIEDIMVGRMSRETVSIYREICRDAA